MRDINTGGQRRAVVKKIKELAADQTSAVGILGFVAVSGKAIMAAEPRAAAVNLKHRRAFGVIGERAGAPKRRHGAGQEKPLKDFHNEILYFIEAASSNLINPNRMMRPHCPAGTGEWPR